MRGLTIFKIITVVYPLLSSLSCFADVKIAGGAAPMNNIFKKIAEPVKNKKGVTIILEETGPELAMQKLDKGEIAAATAGLALEDLFQLVKEKNIILTNSKDKFKSRTIGMDLIQVVIHPSNKVKSLTKEQLNDLFTGKVKNWKEIGGADLQVWVVHGEKIGGTNKVFQNKVLNGNTIKPSETVNTVPEILVRVAAKPGALGLATIGSQIKDVDIPIIPEIGRPISLVTIGAPGKEMQTVLDFISGEGKLLIINK